MTEDEMSTGAIEHRVDHLLRLCDRDHDDVLDVSDFEEWVDRLGALRGWEPGSPGYESLTTLFVAEAWDGVIEAVGSSDGRVGLAAMRDFLISVANTYAPQFEEWADALFELLDADGDGAIGREEYRDLLASLCVAPAAADVSFARYEVDGAGRLSRASFSALYLGFYLVEDPQAPASGFWGPVSPPGI